MPLFNFGRSPAECPFLPSGFCEGRVARKTSAPRLFASLIIPLERAEDAGNAVVAIRVEVVGAFEQQDGLRVIGAQGVDERG